jgi:hypothetical protein
MARKSKTYQTSLGFFEQVAEIECQSVNLT